jgi:hypothetical protein
MTSTTNSGENVKMETQITNRQTVTNEAECYRFNDKHDGVIANTTEIKTINDHNNEDQTVVDSDYYVRGFGEITTRHSVVGGEDIRFSHTVNCFGSQRDLKVSATAHRVTDASVRSVRVKLESQGSWEGIGGSTAIVGNETTMRNLAEAILTALDGEQA